MADVSSQGRRAARKKSSHSEEQVAYALRFAESGTPMADVAARSGRDIALTASLGIALGVGLSAAAAAVTRRLAGPLATLESSVVLVAIAVLLAAVGVPAARPAIRASAADPLPSLRAE